MPCQTCAAPLFLEERTTCWTCSRRDLSRVESVSLLAAVRGAPEPGVMAQRGAIETAIRMGWWREYRK